MEEEEGGGGGRRKRKRKRVVTVTVEFGKFDIEADGQNLISRGFYFFCKFLGVFGKRGGGGGREREGERE
jgi:hypothetical protein